SFKRKQVEGPFGRGRAQRMIKPCAAMSSSCLKVALRRCRLSDRAQAPRPCVAGGECSSRPPPHLLSGAAVLAELLHRRHYQLGCSSAPSTVRSQSRPPLPEESPR